MPQSYRIEPPFRAEHVGSLLRPRALKDAAKALERGELAQEEFAAVLEREIARVVHLQELVGLRSVTDGEFGRSSWFGFFFERLQGFTLEPSLFKFHDSEGHDYEWQTCYTAGKIRRPAPISTGEFERLRRLTHETPKANLPSPSALHFFRGDACRDPEVYPEMDAWWDDVVEIYRAEIRSLVEAECNYLQLDEVPIAMLCDPQVREQAAALGSHPDRLIARYIDTVNRILDPRPQGLTVGMHLCRGNFRSRWMAEGGYEPVAERLFNDLHVDAFFLEYDTPRAGDFEPLRFVPEDKVIVLGLVSTKMPELEPQEVLRGRIDEASRYVPLERLALSPQCGFASVAGGNPLSEEEQSAKLRLVADTARAVWG